MEHLASMHKALASTPSTSQNYVDWSMPISEFSVGEVRSSSHPWLQSEFKFSLGYWDPVSRKKKCSERSTRESLLRVIMEVLLLEHRLAILKAVNGELCAALQTALRESISFLPCQGYTQTNSVLRWIFPCQHSHYKKQ